MKINEVKNLEELAGFAKKYLGNLEVEAEESKASVVTLSGDLGAGKTTFVQRLAKELGVVEVVQSPTFTIYKVYSTQNEKFKSLVHMDAYRIEEESELKPLNFFALLKEPNTLICIEWPEKIKSAIPPGAFTLTFEHAGLDENSRKITEDRFGE